MAKQYIIIKDSKGNKNIWEVIDRLEEFYVIQSRETRFLVKYDRCFEVKKSKLLYCDEDLVVDVLDSNIEIESIEEFEDLGRVDVVGDWAEDDSWIFEEKLEG